MGNTINVTFTTGQTATYTRNILPLLKTDNAVVEIVDTETAEVIFSRDPWDLAGLIYRACSDMDAADYAETADGDILDIYHYIMRKGYNAARAHFLALVWGES